MAAASIKHSAHKIFGSRSSLSKSEPANPEQKQKELQFICDFVDQQVSDAPVRKQNGIQDQKLGNASRQLALKDFKLLKTLGTGQNIFPRNFVKSHADTRGIRNIRKGMAFILGIYPQSKAGPGLCDENSSES